MSCPGQMLGGGIVMRGRVNVGVVMLGGSHRETKLINLTNIKMKKSLVNVDGINIIKKYLFIFLFCFCGKLLNFTDNYTF